MPQRARKNARRHVQRHARCLLSKRACSREQQRRQRRIWRERAMRSRQFAPAGTEEQQRSLA